MEFYIETQTSGRKKIEETMKVEKRRKKMINLFMRNLFI